MTSLARADGTDFARRIRWLGWAMCASWTACALLSLFWNRSHLQQETLDIARHNAKVAFEKDLAYATWNTDQGGVYVAETPSIPPNPHLPADDRAVHTASGATLTRVTAAYMTRLIHERQELPGVRSHTTSLEPLRPGNAPDAWEKRALMRFNEGADEEWSVETMAGESFLRFMKPLRAEKVCQKCHEAQKLEIGDVRGGLSVSVALAPLRALEDASFHKLLFVHIGWWLAGLLGIVLGTHYLARQARRRAEAEGALQRAFDELELRVQERTAELSAANRHLLELDRLKSAFLSSISHEFRTPLTPIMGFATLVRRDVARLRKALPEADDKLARRADRAETNLGIIAAQASHLTTLVDEIMDLVKIESGDVRWDDEPFSLAGAIEECVQEASAALPDDGSLVVQADVQDDLVPVVADRKRIKQLLDALLGNAVKFTQTGQVTVTASRGDAGWVQVQVRDTGVGIPQRDLERVFDKFHQVAEGDAATDKPKGTGLGLAICKNIVEQYEGDIRVESTPGEGSTFIFTLPTATNEGGD